MLLGQAIAVLDDKKRIILPAKFRSAFNDETIIMSRGFEGCLVIRSLDEFKKWQDKILQQSEGQKDSRILARQVFANSEQLSIDAKGRINVPSSLLEIAKIKSKVIIIGMSNRLEVWSEENWNSFNKATKDKIEDAAEKLKDL